MTAPLSGWLRIGGSLATQRFLLAATAALLSGHAGHAEAQDAALARSSSRKISIFGDGGTAWCRPAVGLRLVVEPGSPDAATPPDALVPLMNRLGSLITKRCPTATSADLGVVHDGKALKRFHAEQAGGWVFAAVVPPAEASVGADLDAAVPKPPAASPIAPPPAQTASALPAAPAPPSVPLPLENFDGLMLRLAHDTPEILASDDVATWWASGHEREMLSRSRNDDFAMHALLQRARGEMRAAIAAHDLSIVHVSVQAEFKTYDFSSGRFPLPTEGSELSLRDLRCCVGGKMPYTIALHVDGMDAVDGFRMDQASASAFIDRRMTGWGGSNRTVYVDYVVKLAPGPMQTVGYGQAAYQGTVVGATIYDDQAHRTVLGIIDQASIQQRLQADAAAKQAEDAKAADAQRQQKVAMLAQQRQTYVQMAQSWPRERRIPFLLTSDSLYGSDTLEDVRSLRVAALLAAKPVPATLLFQVDGDGEKSIPTRWPGKMTVDVPGGATLKTSRWYVAKGSLSLPEPDGSVDAPLPDAAFVVRELHACSRDRCAESDDIAAAVDAKITTQGSMP